MKNNLQKNQAVYFQEESLPYTVRAISERYAVCTRKFDPIEDLGEAEHQVKMGGYSNIKQAMADLKNDYVYCIIDFEANIRGPHNMIFNMYSFGKDEEMDLIISDLEVDDLELSRRNSCPLNIDWYKTNLKQSLKTFPS